MLFDRAAKMLISSRAAREALPELPRGRDLLPMALLGEAAMKLLLFQLLAAAALDFAPPALQCAGFPLERLRAADERTDPHKTL